jgi:hypothetical protein
LSPRDDPTGRLLAPRQRSRIGTEAAGPPHAAPRRSAWRYGAAVGLLVAAAATGKWLWPSAGNVPTAASPPIDGSAPRGVAAAVSGRAPTPPATVIQDPAKAPAPLTSLSELLQRPASARWRWSRFKANPAIVVIEYPDLHQQGLAMNRLAAMFEKRTARRDRVPSDGEVDELIRRSGDTIGSFYQGHDYPGAKVARFFSLAEAQRVALNPQESQLRSLLLEAGLMRRGATGAFEAVGEQAAISFTAVQPDDPAIGPDERIDGVRRAAVLHHELSHGEFFTNPAYRAHCMKFWRDVLRPNERRMFSAYLKSLDYNPGDEELMANETQALLMHTPDSRAFNAGSLGISESALAQLRSRFSAGEPAREQTGS